MRPLRSMIGFEWDLWHPHIPREWAMSDLHTQIAPHTAVSGLASKNDRPQLCARKNLLTFVRSPGLSSRLQSYYRLHVQTCHCLLPLLESALSWLPLWRGVHWLFSWGEDCYSVRHFLLTFDEVAAIEQSVGWLSWTDHTSQDNFFPREHANLSFQSCPCFDWTRAILSRF